MEFNSYYMLERVFALTRAIVVVANDDACSLSNSSNSLCVENVPTKHKVMYTRCCETHVTSGGKNKGSYRDYMLLIPTQITLTFVPENREEAHALQRRLACATELSVVRKEHEPNNNEQDVPSIKFGDESTEPPAKVVILKSADKEDWLDKIVCTGESRQSTGKVPPHMTVLEWWEANKAFWPRLSRLAKKYLCCPASSVASERVFSLARQVMNKKRCRLSADNVDMLVFLNKNLESYW
ncbi:ZBED1-like protein [Mya arenaria]|uniref:ZBED1-like protein n=1 Tax=Mya arenaria TaxID=6604 RepID=A0ABY7G1T1_MYAAR|nr:ZBED1-like protein [Mya arenaria]